MQVGEVLRDPVASDVDDVVDDGSVMLTDYRIAGIESALG